MPLKVLILITLMVSSCDSILIIKTNFEPHAFQITQLPPRVYQPGERVPIKGEFFFDKMRVEIAGVEYPVVYPEETTAELGYETDASFVLPTDAALLSAAGTKTGKLAVDMKRNNRVVPLDHIYLAEEKNFPLYVGDASWICDSN